MKETRTCIECNAVLPANVPDIFCPSCALHRALAVGDLPDPDSPPLNEARSRTRTWISSYFRFLPLKKKTPGGSQTPPIGVASAEEKDKHWSPMNMASPLPGDIIEEYEILERVGGNMGLVFKARHRLLDKIVALKLLPADSIADSARWARFQREMRVMGKVEHPNLLAAADARSLESWHLVAMEWIDGIDLHRLIRNQGPLPIDAACEITRQAALGLEYAHRHGLIHRDIKPSNLMLNRSGTIKVIDMGLALIQDDTTAQLTHTGIVLGTLNYCAPEQFQDSSRVDIRADIYSLGCTLYHLLAGRPPYWERRTFAEILQAHLHESLPSLWEFRPHIPAELEAVLNRMTAKDPASRFTTPGEVAEALEPLAQGADLKPFLPDEVQEEPRARLNSGKPQGATTGRRPAMTSVDSPKSHWTRRAALFAGVPGIAGVAYLFGKYRNRDEGITISIPGEVHIEPVIVLMDTTARRGIYDEDNGDNEEVRKRGYTNAVVLQRVLSDLGTCHSEQISEDSSKVEWRGEKNVLSLHPEVVLIHRSAFFHAVNVDMNFDYPPEGVDPEKDPKYRQWTLLYKIMDDKLVCFMGNVGKAELRTHFLIYSRGTGKDWLDKTLRDEWVQNIEERFPHLKNRIRTMEVRPGLEGKKTFRDKINSDAVRELVRKILAGLGYNLKEAN